MKIWCKLHTMGLILVLMSLSIGAISDSKDINATEKEIFTLYEDLNETEYTITTKYGYLAPHFGDTYCIYYRSIHECSFGFNITLQDNEYGYVYLFLPDNTKLKKIEIPREPINIELSDFDVEYWKEMYGSIILYKTDSIYKRKISFTIHFKKSKELDFEIRNSIYNDPITILGNELDLFVPYPEDDKNIKLIRVAIESYDGTAIEWEGNKHGKILLPELDEDTLMIRYNVKIHTDDNKYSTQFPIERISKEYYYMHYYRYNKTKIHYSLLFISIFVLIFLVFVKCKEFKKLKRI